jgi:hypothetical protein
MVSSFRAKRAGAVSVVAADLFFRLTAARVGRIPVIRQPRIEGRGAKQGALARPCPSAIHGAKLQVPGFLWQQCVRASADLRRRLRLRR